MKTHWKMGIYSTIGAGLGYAWYYFVGCSNGCPISSSWINSTLYGAFMGFIYGIPTNKFFERKKAKIKE